MHETHRAVFAIIFVMTIIAVLTALAVIIITRLKSKVFSLERL